MQTSQVLSINWSLGSRHSRPLSRDIILLPILSQAWPTYCFMPRTNTYPQLLYIQQEEALLPSIAITVQQEPSYNKLLFYLNPLFFLQVTIIAQNSAINLYYVPLYLVKERLHRVQATRQHYDLLQEILSRASLPRVTSHRVFASY